MRLFRSVLKMSICIFFLLGITGFVSDKGLPTVKGKKTVASVNGEPITLDELNQDLALSFSGKQAKTPGKKEISEVLKRLINTRLIIQEADRMGLDELKEIKMMVDVFSKATLREELIEKHVKNIKPDEREVEKLYQQRTKEWRMNAVFFESEEDAKKLEKALKEGKDFSTIAKQMLSDKTAKEVDEGKYYKGTDLLPEIGGALSRMDKGSVSPIIQIKNGFVIVKLEDARLSDDPKAKDWAREQVLRKAQREALTEYDKALKEKYAKVNQKVFDTLDLDAKEPGFGALLKDKRVLVEVKKDKPITVGDFADYLRQQFFHGVERAAEKKKLNTKKVQILEEMMHKKVFRVEALRLGIDKTETYKSKVKEHENSLVFGAFIKKAIQPDIKLRDEELKSYYDSHSKEYTYPEMMKITNLVFANRKDAESNIEKLKKGMDFNWLKSNADGQMDPTAKGILSFDGKLLTTKDLPEEVQKAVSGARSGDYRFYESPEHHYYVLYVQEVVPPKAQPYPEVREKIAKNVYNNKLKKAVEDYADKLRAASEVKIYLK